jgi:hypothetical protein
MTVLEDGLVSPLPKTLATRVWMSAKGSYLFYILRFEESGLVKRRHV